LFGRSVENISGKNIVHTGNMWPFLKFP